MITDFKNQRGLSIVEGLIAFLIITLVFTAFASFFYQSKKMVTVQSQKSDCATHLNYIITRLDSVGETHSIENHVPTLASLKKIQADKLVAADSGIADADRWTFNTLDPGAVPNFRNSVLINSYMTLLASIYNSAPAYCATGATYAGGLLNPADDENVSLTNLNTTIQIRPYDLTTNALVGCPSPLIPRPRGLAPTTEAAAAGYATVPAESRNDFGFEVILRANYTNLSGAPEACEMTKRYAFDRDTGKPQDPTLNNWIYIRPNCLAAGPIAPAALHTVGFNIPMEAGTQLICKDKSSVNRPAPTQICINGPIIPAAVLNGVNLWKPCFELEACGVAPIVTPILGAGNKAQYAFNFIGLPYDCNLSVDIVAIDSSGNASNMVNLASHVVEMPACNTCGVSGAQYCACPVWVASGWGACVPNSGTCGDGTKTQTHICQDPISGTPVPPADCPVEPVVTDTCNIPCAGPGPTPTPGPSVTPTPTPCTAWLWLCNNNGDVICTSDVGGTYPDANCLPCAGPKPDRATRCPKHYWKNEGPSANPCPGVTVPCPPVGPICMDWGPNLYLIPGDYYGCDDGTGCPYQNVTCRP